MNEETETAEMPIDAPTETTEMEAQAPPVEVEAPDDAGTEPQEDKPKGGFQRRIKEVTDDRNYWRELALRNSQQPAQKPVEPPKEAVAQKLPSLEEYGYDEAKYQSALLDYADKRAEAAVERRLAEREQQQKEQTRMESFVTRQKEFAKATPDFEDKVLRDPTLPITNAMRDVIVDSPAGPELAYYLANNREAAESIATLPPHLAALEMGRIEGRLSALKEAQTRPVPVVSKAPPPPPKVDDTSPMPKVSTTDPDSDRMSDDEWVRAEKKRMARKR